jgi:Right handed beta helix region/PKD domain
MLPRIVVSLPLLALSSAIGRAAVIQPNALNSTAINQAIQQAKPGDTVLLLPGTYSLTDAIRPRSGIHLIGSGITKTTLIYNGNQVSSMVVIDGCSDFELAAMTLDGQMNPLIDQGVSGSNSQKLWLHGFRVTNLANGGRFGPHAIFFSGTNPTSTGGVTDSLIERVAIDNVGVGAQYGGGIRLSWGSNRNVVRLNEISITGRGGIFGDHSTDLTIKGNHVSGSGGEGLGIEVWGGCHRSVVEDNLVDHWISNDGGNNVAIRRNRIGTLDGTLKWAGIEVVGASNVVVTDNVIAQGAQVGISMSNAVPQDNFYWGYNVVSGCNQWGAQLQGETGGIRRNYFNRCLFQKTLRNSPTAPYPTDSGHGFRFNGNSAQIVFENCLFRNNGGLGVQLTGADQVSFVRCSVLNNALAAFSVDQLRTVEFLQGGVAGNGNNLIPIGLPFAGPAPAVFFGFPSIIRHGEPAIFRPAAKGAAIAEALWDFNDGTPETTGITAHTFALPGVYRVTLIVWDNAGRGARAERFVVVR